MFFYFVCMKLVNVLVFECLTGSFWKLQIFGFCFSLYIYVLILCMSVSHCTAQLSMFLNGKALYKILFFFIIIIIIIIIIHVSSDQCGCICQGQGFNSWQITRGVSVSFVFKTFFYCQYFNNSAQNVVWKCQCFCLFSSLQKQMCFDQKWSM